jgi:hypothetical protein
MKIASRFSSPSPDCRKHGRCQRPGFAPNRPSFSWAVVLVACANRMRLKFTDRATPGQSIFFSVRRLRVHSPAPPTRYDERSDHGKQQNDAKGLGHGKW